MEIEKPTQDLFLDILTDKEAVKLKDEICLVCHQKLKPGEEIGKTHCGHIFHVSCIGSWLQ